MLGGNPLDYEFRRPMRLSRTRSHGNPSSYGSCIPKVWFTLVMKYDVLSLPFAFAILGSVHVCEKVWLELPVFHQSVLSLTGSVKWSYQFYML